MWAKVRSPLARPNSNLKHNPKVSLKPTLRLSPTLSAEAPPDVRKLESQTGFP